jgi:NADPH-dependent 2,4-dienoyl-CoA reductase/sulfur reductase-like enzyme
MMGRMVSDLHVASRSTMEVLRADIAIIGGGLGACAAALSAARLGRRVILTAETQWLGGQLTNQAVPPDEHPWIEEFGATATYREGYLDIGCWPFQFRSAR